MLNNVIDMKYRPASAMVISVLLYLKVIILLTALSRIIKGKMENDAKLFFSGFFY